MEYFNRELVNTMLHLGVDKIGSLGPDHVTRAVNALALDDTRGAPAK